MAVGLRWASPWNTLFRLIRALRQTASLSLINHGRGDSTFTLKKPSMDLAQAPPALH